VSYLYISIDDYHVFDMLVNVVIRLHPMRVLFSINALSYKIFYDMTKFVKKERRNFI
jgi:hypothetical protein